VSKTAEHSSGRVVATVRPVNDILHGRSCRRSASPPGLHRVHRVHKAHSTRPIHSHRCGAHPEPLSDPGSAVPASSPLPGNPTMPEVPWSYSNNCSTSSCTSTST
jgi:hypothetical protein